MTTRAREPRALMRSGPFASLAVLACGGGLSIAACSSSAEPLPRSTSPDSGADAAAKVEACFAKCEKDHPSSLSRYDAIDECWEKSCKGPCIDQSGSFDAGEAGTGAKVNDGGAPLCATDTPSFTDKACDDCIEARCCPSWKGCYEDTDCRAFDNCIIDCLPEQ